MKKIGILLLIIIIAALGITYYFRYDIFQYSAEKIIKDKLPPYVTVKRIIFDLPHNKMTVKGLSIRNPREFSQKFLVEIDEVTCRYKMKGINVLDGIEITEITARGPGIDIERLSSGKINVTEMGEVMVAAAPGAVSPEMAPVEATDTRGKQEEKTEREVSATGRIMGKSISDLIKLPDVINIEGGKVVFTDEFIMRQPYTLTFEEINASLSLRLNKDYTAVTGVSTQGSGLLNGEEPQRINWVISLDPTARALTMSNRFEIRNIDITLFRPYYESYSPISIYAGRASGTLVFDFDHGNIGSMNTLVVRGLRFREKSDGASYGWETSSMAEIIKYLSSAPDEVTFDFAIKGTIDEPRFYPGPYVKQAIQSMVVDKVGQAIQEFTKKEGEGQGSTGKVADVIRGFLNR